MLALQAFLRARHLETLRVFNKHGYTDSVVKATVFPIEYLIKPAQLSEHSLKLCISNSNSMNESEEANGGERRHGSSQERPESRIRGGRSDRDER